MNCAKRFENKVVIVTGAAQGIGRGVALQVASEGAQVVLADISDYVDETLAKLKHKKVMQLSSRLTWKPLRCRICGCPSN